jgi:hypothetical protein
MKTTAHQTTFISTFILLILGFALLAFAIIALRWGAAFAAHATTASIMSSPSSGQPGTTVYVSGSGIPDPSSSSIPELVTFGYSTSSTCTPFSIVGPGSNPTISGGSFSNATFTWPSSGTTAGTTYTVCAQISGVSGTNPLVLAGNSFLVQGNTTSSTTSTTGTSNTIKNSPASGLPGTIITVTGSNITPPAGSATEKVTFGYSANPSCNLFYKVGNGSNPKVSQGSFSGTFTWPNSPSTEGKTFTVCARINNVNGGATLTLAGNSFLVTPLITSSPTSGPAGTTILVAGSYIPPPSGSATEKVTFGYSPDATCDLFYKMGSGSNSKVSHGRFSNTFTWPSSGTTVSTKYYICIQINNISGGGTLTLPSSSTFTVTS